MWEMWTDCEDSASFAPFDQELFGLAHSDLDEASFDFNLSIAAATGSSESSRDDRDDFDDDEYLDIIGMASNGLDLLDLDVSSLIESLGGETLLSSSLFGTSPVTGNNISTSSNSTNMSMSANSSVANVECSKFLSTSPSSHGSSMVKFASATGTMDCNLALRANSHPTFSNTGNSKDCSTSLLGKTILGKRRKVSQHPTMNKKKKKKNKCIRGGISLLARPSPVPSAIVQQRTQRERDSARETILKGKGDSNQLICSRDSNNNSTLVSSSLTCTSTSTNTKCQISTTMSSPNRSNYSKFSSTPFTLSNSHRDHDYWH